MERIIYETADLSDDEIKTAFGKSLKALRQHCNLTLRDLQENTLVPYQSLSVYEQGKNMPTIAQALRIVRHFNLSIDDFIWYGLGCPQFIGDDFPDITTKYDIENHD